MGRDKSAYVGRLVLVAGGSQGIGRSIAVAFAAAGAHVVVLARSQQRLELVLRELEGARQRPEQRFSIRSVDVRDWDATRSTIDAIVAEFGTPGIVVVTAGYARPGYAIDLDLAHYRSMMELNYFGTLHVVKAVLPHLMATRHGIIVTTSSMAGLAGVFGYTGYSATKFAIRGFSEALRRELRPFGIRVSVLCPPNTRTPGFDEENRYKPAEVLKAEEKVSTVDPDVVAAALLRQLPSNPSIITATFDSRLAQVLIRLAPWIVDRALRRPALDI